MDTISDNEVLQRLMTSGIGSMPPNRIGELIDALESRAADTGLAAPLFVAEAFKALESLFEDRGAVRTEFLSVLDARIRGGLTSIQFGDPLQSTAKARTLRDDLWEMVSAYNPKKSSPT